MTAYSTTDDLLIGDVQLPVGNDGTKYVNQAADEIDSRLGFIYATPFNLATGSTLSRPAQLLVKQLSIHISSGRAMMDLSTSGENGMPNPYGKYLLDQAEAMLALIVEGRVILDGAAPANPGDGGTTEFSSRVLIHNADPYSMVEAFYDWGRRPALFPGGGPFVGGFADGSFLPPFGR